MKNIWRRPLGGFRVEGGVIRVSDPCYCPMPREGHGDALEDGHGVIIRPALNGIWLAEIVLSDEGAWGERVAQLWACHETALRLGRPYEFCCEVYVDSGQMGIFDDGRFPRDEAQFEYMDEGSFYKQACNRTYNDQTDEPLRGGCMEFGAVSSSGYGDGSYEALIMTDPTGLVLGVKVNFLNEEDDE